MGTSRTPPPPPLCHFLFLDVYEESLSIHFSKGESIIEKRRGGGDFVDVGIALLRFDTARVIHA